MCNMDKHWALELCVRCVYLEQLPKTVWFEQRIQNSLAGASVKYQLI